MFRFPFPVLLCATLCGCMSFPTAESIDQAEFIEPAHCTAEEVVALPTWAEVEVSNHSPDGRSHSRTTGTVLKATPDGVALFNCVVEHRNERGFDAANRVPYVSRAFPNTGVGSSEIPVLWVPLHDIGAVRIVALPSEGTVPPDIPLETPGNWHMTHGGVI